MKKFKAILLASALCLLFATFLPQNAQSAKQVPYISERTFSGLLHQTRTPMLVQFGAEWCGFCRKLQPALSSFAANNTGKVAVYRINVDYERALADQYRVSSLPTIIFFENGYEVDRITGTPNPSELQDWADQVH